RHRRLTGTDLGGTRPLRIALGGLVVGMLVTLLALRVAEELSESTPRGSSRPASDLAPREAWLSPTSVPDAGPAPTQAPAPRTLPTPRNLPTPRSQPARTEPPARSAPSPAPSPAGARTTSVPASPSNSAP